MISNGNMYTLDVYTLKNYVEAKSRLEVVNIIKNFEDLLIFDKNMKNPIKKEFHLGDWGTKGMLISYETIFAFKNCRRINEIDIIYNLQVVYDYAYVYGNSVHFGRFVQDRQHVEIIIQSPYWSGNCSRFGKYMKDRDILHKIIDSKRWNGECKYFSKCALNCKSFVLKIVNSKRWNGSVTSFGLELLSDLDVLRNIILISKRWNGEAYFPKNMVSQEIIIEGMIESGRWDYDCSHIARGSIKDVNLAIKIVSNPKWDQDLFVFNKSIFENEDFVKIISEKVQPDILLFSLGKKDNLPKDIEERFIISGNDNLYKILLKHIDEVVTPELVST